MTSPYAENSYPKTLMMNRHPYYWKGRAEKEKLIKEGKIKRDKNGSMSSRGDDKSHYENVPFDIPNSWRWVKLGDIAEKIGSGSTPRGGRAVYQSYGVVFIRSQNVYNGGLYLDDVAYITDEINEQMAGTQVQPNDILLNITGASIGRSAIVPSDLGKANVNQHVSIIRLDERQFQPFVHKVLISDYIQSIIKNVQVGAAQEGLPAEKQKEMLIPLPPLAEQHRILTAIESSFAFIDEIEQNKFDLQAAVTATKSKILSLAIRGKFIPQDPNDEPASVLLDRIRAEREKLIKAGKIKRDKSDSAIVMSDDNSYYGKIPFVVPETWQWYRLSECWDLLSGRDLTPSEYSAEPIGIPYITGASNFIDDELIINRWTEYPKVVAKNGDLLITCKGTVGVMRINTQGEVHIARQIMAIRNRSGLNTKFLQIVMASFILQITSAAKGIIPGISREDLLDMVIPCPPIEEQSRIVTAVDESQSILNEIAENLNSGFRLFRQIEHR